MRQRWAWIGSGGLLLASILAGFLWAGTTGTPAFVDSTGRIVPSMTQARPMWIPAAVCITATPGSVLDLPATNPAVPACVTGTTNVQQGVLDFADAANLSTQYAYLLPTIWTGNIDLRLLWFSPTTTGNVVWQVQAACTALGVVDDPTWDTDILALTDATQGTANQLNEASGTLVTTTHLSSCTAGQRLHLKLFRDSAHASDTMAGTARLLGMEVMIRLTFT